MLHGRTNACTKNVGLTFTANFSAACNNPIVLRNLFFYEASIAGITPFHQFIFPFTVALAKCRLNDEDLRRAPAAAKGIRSL